MAAQGTPGVSHQLRDGQGTKWIMQGLVSLFMPGLWLVATGRTQMVPWSPGSWARGWGVPGPTWKVTSPGKGTP